MSRFASFTTRFLSIVIAPMVLSGCLMNEPTEVTSVTNNAPPPTPQNNAPTISGTPPSMVKVGVNYAFMPVAADADADTLVFSVQNLPNWLSFDTNTGGIAGMPVLGNEGFYGNIMITVSDGAASASTAPFSITVEPATAANMPPEIDGVPPSSVTIGANYNFTPSASDPDGDLLTFTIQNAPGWINFNSSNGQMTGSPLVTDAGTYANISITVSDQVASASLPAFSIDVVAPNSVPTISGTPAASVTAGTSYDFTPSATDADGDPLTFAISNLPGWAAFDATTGRLSGVPQAGDIGTYANIVISVDDGQASAALPAFSINVVAGNSAPAISGNPPASILVGQSYSFTPVASDPDGDTLTFSIQNRPAWINFNSTSGSITGTPQSGDVGVHAQIVISASDGNASASLPAFSITVNSPNSAPQISGTPATQVTVGQAYSFAPVANDADGDSLTFSIQNLPSWASFDTNNGTLSGTPAVGDAGSYTNITISVSDGSLSDTLPAFSIDVAQASVGSATLNWTPPTQNSDGSPLTDLAGYNVYYGTAPGSYGTPIYLNNPGLSSYTVNNLSSNTYYFVVTAVNSMGVESNFSNMATKTIN